MNNNVIFVGPPGCGKTHNAKKYILDIIAKKEYNNIYKAFSNFSLSKETFENCDNVKKVYKTLKDEIPQIVKFVALQPNYCYSDFVEGIIVDSNNGELQTRYQKKVIIELVDNMKYYNAPGFLILDDADRVAISDLFGDVYTAINNRENKVRLISGNEISIPNNLYIVITYGTLNDGYKLDYDFMSGFNIIQMNANYIKLRPTLLEYVKRLSDSKENKDNFIDSVVGKDKYDNESLYGLYNRSCKDISYEFKSERQDYEIGFSYFLPNGNDIQEIEMVCQHKIHHQVIPLLKQYAKAGIIDKKNIPGVERTNTVFVRDRKNVYEPRIEIVLDEETEQFARRMIDQGITYKNTDRYIRDGRLPVNSNYLMLFEIIRDVINNNLINDYQLMDLLLRDERIVRPRPDLKIDDVGLLTLEKNVDVVLIANSGRNAQSFYGKQFHHLIYRGSKYYMITKITQDKTCPRDYQKCLKQGGAVQNQSCNPSKALKVFVVRYLELYCNNLRQYMLEETNEALKEEAEETLRYALEDIEKAKLFTTEEKYVNEWGYIGKAGDPNMYKTFVDKIRSLETWKRMLGNLQKGIYRTMDRKYKDIMDATGIHQMILQGPPGTSKTYGAKEFLANQIGLISDLGEKWDGKELESHKLTLNNGEYELPSNPVNTSKKIYWDVIQFHPSYCYEDFIRGITVSTENNKKINGKIMNSATSYDMILDAGNGMSYKTLNKTFGALCDIAQKNEGTFYLLVDEINRANLATVFGELIYALEYRDEDVATPYTIDGAKTNSINVPDNLYIIGTMNTADKSIGSIDYAIRRRFLFFPVLPSAIPVKHSIPNYENWKESDEIKLFFAIDKLFNKCLNKEDYDKDDVQIGHTYFIRREDSNTKYRFIYQVIPVVKEYVKDGVIIKNDNESDLVIKTIFEMTECREIKDLEDKYSRLLNEIKANESDYQHYIEGLN